MSASFIENVNKLVQFLADNPDLLDKLGEIDTKLVQALKDLDDALQNALNNVSNKVTSEVNTQLVPIVDSINQIKDDHTNTLLDLQDALNTFMAYATDITQGTVILSTNQNTDDTVNHVITEKVLNNRIAAELSTLPTATTENSGIVELATSKEVEVMTPGKVLTTDAASLNALPVPYSKLFVQGSNYCLTILSPTTFLVNLFGSCSTTCATSTTVTSILFPVAVRENSISAVVTPIYDGNVDVTTETDLVATCCITDKSANHVEVSFRGFDGKIIKGAGHYNITAFADSVDVSLKSINLKGTVEADTVVLFWEVMLDDD